jgi:hypothetical protein
MNEHSEFSKKGDIMKKRIFIGLLVFFSLMIFFTYAYAIDIDGWWKVGGIIKQGDFVTGEWTTSYPQGKKRAYVYIAGAEENAYNSSGGAWFYLWDGLSGGYIESETYPVIYIKNGLIVLFGPTGYDSDGNFWADTIVLRPYGGPIGHPSLMKGYYTLYDMEKLVTPEQFVRMGQLIITRVEAVNVPDDVKKLQITAPP